MNDELAAVAGAIDHLARMLDSGMAVDRMLEEDTALLAIEVLARAAARRARHEHVIGLSEDAARIELAQGRVIDLSRRHALREILLRLIGARERSEASVHWSELARAGWPDEVLPSGVAFHRVRTAIWSLRRAGLRAIVRARDGYAIDSRARLDWR